MIRWIIILTWPVLLVAIARADQVIYSTWTIPTPIPTVPSALYILPHVETWEIGKCIFCDSEGICEWAKCPSPTPSPTKERK